MLMEGFSAGYDAPQEISNKNDFGLSSSPYCHYE
jgi:hypothetical protein